MSVRLPGGPQLLTVFLAAFGGLDGLLYSGEQVDTPALGSPRTTSLGGGESPYPFFGLDLLWAPGLLGGRLRDAISLGLVLALTTEDASGFGGKVFTVDVGYGLHFGGEPADTGQATSAP